MLKRALCCIVLLLLPRLSSAADAEPAWTKAYEAGPPSAAETRELIEKWTRFVLDHHLKKDEESEQRGMIYEYLDFNRRGQSDQFIQGEALDTMHDGAWFAAAMVNAYRATGDAQYKRVLVEWQLPFYLKMLNHSDTLFSNNVNHARPERQELWTESKEWLLQNGEKGLVPYWWDDGGSVSLERRIDKNPLPAFPSFDRYLAMGKPNPEFRLSGYSFGSSNHMAQDLGVMLQQAWLLFRESRDPADAKLAAELAEGCQNLYECRMRHHGHIPMSDGPWALASGDDELLKRLPDCTAASFWKPNNAYVKTLYDFAPQARITTPGFADDIQYRYYAAIARHGGELPRPIAFKTIYDAYTDRLLYRYYSDDAPVPPGINRFDLHPITFVDGKPADYRSDRKGPGGKPRPIGSRMGPQTMVACGWALQALRAYPGIWEERFKAEFSQDIRVAISNLRPDDADDGIKLQPAVKLGPIACGLLSDQSSLLLVGDCRGDSATIRIFSRPEANGTHATIRLARGKEIEVVNDQGQSLQFRGDLKADGDGLKFELRIPYTLVKGQGVWANGIEHGRYSIGVGDTVKNFYLASSEQQVKAMLERELAGGLRTWDAIFRQWGYVPTGIAAGANWENLSDTGGYAHLVSAASQWLLYLDQKNDWSQHHVPALPSK